MTSPSKSDRSLKGCDIAPRTHEAPETAHDAGTSADATNSISHGRRTSRTKAVQESQVNSKAAAPSKGKGKSTAKKGNVKGNAKGKGKAKAPSASIPVPNNNGALSAITELDDE